jgi:hypothetical protein
MKHIVFCVWEVYTSYIVYRTSLHLQVPGDVAGHYHIALDYLVLDYY